MASVSSPSLDRPIQLPALKNCEFGQRAGFNPPIEILTAGGYGILAVITTLAIWAIAVSVSFIGAGFLLAQYYGPGGDLSVMILWFSNSFYLSLICGTILSIYPIIQVASTILNQAKVHWNNAQSK
jgi:hypothetical protein